eukprot:gene12590-biopygen2215
MPFSRRSSPTPLPPPYLAFLPRGGEGEYEPSAVEAEPVGGERHAERVARPRAQPHAARPLLYKKKGRRNPVVRASLLMDPYMEIPGSSGNPPDGRLGPDVGRGHARLPVRRGSWGSTKRRRAQLNKSGSDAPPPARGTSPNKIAKGQHFLRRNLPFERGKGRPDCRSCKRHSVALTNGRSHVKEAPRPIEWSEGVRINGGQETRQRDLEGCLLSRWGE